MTYNGRILICSKYESRADMSGMVSCENCNKTECYVHGGEGFKCEHEKAPSECRNRITVLVPLWDETGQSITKFACGLNPIGEDFTPCKHECHYCHANQIATAGFVGDSGEWYPCCPSCAQDIADECEAMRAGDFNNLQRSRA